MLLQPRVSKDKQVLSEASDFGTKLLPVPKKVNGDVDSMSNVPSQVVGTVNIENADGVCKCL